jgi:hypothetical protein
VKLPFASRGQSLVALALAEAEDGLGALPLTDEVRHLQTRLVALKSVSVGLVQGVPKVTEAQRSRFVVDSLALAGEVTSARERLGG